LELQKGTLGGRFTTLEGLLENIYEEIDGRISFTKGDSVQEEKRKELARFLASLRSVGSIYTYSDVAHCFFA
jgi:zinc finger protein